MGLDSSEEICGDNSVARSSGTFGRAALVQHISRRSPERQKWKLAIQGDGSETRDIAVAQIGGEGEKLG